MVIRRVLLVVGVVTGCTSVPPVADAGLGHVVSAELVACAAQQEAVPSIQAFLAHLNSLPHPVSVGCAVASLPRPLVIVATSNFTSAQPASGPKNPRVFILEPGVVFSVVADGPGRHLIELGQWVTPLRTLKGELELPLVDPVAPTAPFSRVMYNESMTNCALCHRNESAHETIDGGYVSAAYRPSDDSIVGLNVLREQHQACIDEVEAPPDGGAERCDQLHALFDFGPVRQGAFDNAVELFVK